MGKGLGVWARLSGAWQRRGCDPIPAVPPPLPVLGVDKPGPSNTGLRLVAESQLVDHYGDYHAVTGEEISGLRIHGSVIIDASATDVHLHDCHILGPLSYGDASPTQMVIGRYNNLQGAVIEDCLIDGARQHSPWMNGIDAGNFTLRRCELKGVIDALSLSSQHGNVTIEQCWIHGGDYVAWEPGTPGMPSQSDNQTHSDGIQIHRRGNIYIRGNVVGGERVVVTEDVHTADGVDERVVKKRRLSDDWFNAAIMVKQEMGNDPAEKLDPVVIEDNWFYGGNSFVNLAVKPSSQNPWDFLDGVVLRDNKFGRVNPDMPNSNSFPYIIHHADANATVTGNVFEDDGSPVPVKRWG